MPRHEQLVPWSEIEDGALHGPVLLMNGNKTDFMMETAKSTYDGLDGARRRQVANVVWSWAAWQLKGDKKAGAMFAGKDCGLCKDSNWDVRAKGLK